jgi:hypothetical protein
LRNILDQVFHSPPSFSWPLIEQCPLLGLLGRLGSNTLIFQERLNGIGWNSTLLQPVLNPFGFKGYLRRIRQGIVGADIFQEPSVTLALAVRHHNPVKRAFGRTVSCQSDFYCH